LQDWHAQANCAVVFLRKYTDDVKNLRQRRLTVTLMWWNDVCRQRGRKAKTPAFFVKFLTTRIVPSAQHVGAPVDRHCSKQGPRKTAGFRSRSIYTG
jgi:hypothetical protein